MHIHTQPKTILYNIANQSKPYSLTNPQKTRASKTSASLILKTSEISFRSSSVCPINLHLPVGCFIIFRCLHQTPIYPAECLSIALEIIHIWSSFICSGAHDRFSIRKHFLLSSKCNFVLEEIDRSLHWPLLQIYTIVFCIFTVKAEIGDSLGNNC